MTLYTSTIPYFTNVFAEASTCNVLLCKVLSSDALKSCPCSSIEKKYQDQLKSLQGELEQERGQSSALRNRLDSEKEKIEEEEKSLRLRLMASQKVIYSVWTSKIHFIQNLFDDFWNWVYSQFKIMMLRPLQSSFCGFCNKWNKVRHDRGSGVR